MGVGSTVQERMVESRVIIILSDHGVANDDGGVAHVGCLLWRGLHGRFSVRSPESHLQSVEGVNANGE